MTYGAMIQMNRVSVAGYSLPPLSDYRSWWPAAHGPQAAKRSPSPEQYGPVLGAALCCTNPIVGGAPSQRGRNLFRLAGGLAFAARRPSQPFITTDYRPPSKAQVNHVAHVVSKSSAGTRLARVGVSLQ